MLKSVGSILFSKFLLCSQEWSSDYDFIIFIDADIFININSPPIHINDFGNNIGMVDEFSQPTLEERVKIQREHNWETTGGEYYKNKANVDIETNLLFNAGLMVFQPKIHRLFLEQVYNKYIKLAEDHVWGYHYEQAIIGYEIQINNIFKILDNKFNLIWPLTGRYYKTLNECYENNYFIHFCANSDRRPVKELDLLNDKYYQVNLV